MEKPTARVRTRPEPLPRSWPNGSAVFSNALRLNRNDGPVEEQEGFMGRVVRKDGKSGAFVWTGSHYELVGLFEHFHEALSQLSEVFSKKNRTKGRTKPS